MQKQLKSTNRIELLDNRLANQIAAGEVVDRPSSVLKELMENSIDAGAKKIEVEVERGGIRLIKVTDDGFGIQKNDLSLALTRHATSKIKNVSDLSAIYSLGFRGEALASISSVSRLTLTSRTHDQELAWQAISEGRDMMVDIQPASAVAGTRIEVRDLFFNTPARQKFLRTERTEFLQVEDVFKRIALANFDVSFILKHNGKLVKRIPAVTIDEEHSLDEQLLNDKQFIISSQERKRLAIICGRDFSKSAIAFKCKHEFISVKGFVGGADFHRSESDLQFVFINDRAVKDKTLTHAIRQAYQDRLPPGRMPTYVIYLSVNADKIDVNVHPTKHEVRFENQRDVHDLLFKAINEVLSSEIKGVGLNDSYIKNTSLQNVSSRNDVKSNNIHTTNLKNYSKETLYNHSNNISQNPYLVSEQSAGKYASNIQENTSHQKNISNEIENRMENIQSHSNHSYIRLGKGFSLFNTGMEAWVIDELLWFKKCLLKSSLHDEKLQSIDLLFPEVIPSENTILEECEVSDYLQKMGFKFEPFSNKSIKLMSVPFWSKYFDKSKLFIFFTNWMNALVGFENNKNNIESVLNEVLECWMIDNHTINFFMDLDIIEFEIESYQVDSCAKKITAELVGNWFNGIKEVNESCKYS